MVSLLKRALWMLVVAGCAFAQTLQVPNGGTGRQTMTQHGVVVGNGTGALNTVAPGTSGQCLVSGGTGLDPTFTACPGSTTGLPTLPYVIANQSVASGGCGLQGYPTDDTAALQACINLPANKGKYIVFPGLVQNPNRGGINCDYLFSSTIVIPRTPNDQYGMTLGGESGSYNTSVGLCWTTDVAGILANTGPVTLKGLTIANVSGNQWVRGTIATYGVPTNHHGVQSCGGDLHIKDSTIYYWTGDGVHLASGDCVGSPTDYQTADAWRIENLNVIGVKGYGLFASGSDANVGNWTNGRCIANQLGCFADTAQYGSLYQNVFGDSNGSDPLGPSSTVAITSCTVTAGVASCTIPSHGLIQNDWVMITGNSLSSLNAQWKYINVVDANTISFPAGVCENCSGTGGTAGAQPGARIWATNHLYAGSVFTSNPVGPTKLTNIYMEGTNGLAAVAFSQVQNGQGIMGTTGGYYWANSGTSFARVGSINTAAETLFLQNQVTNWSAFSVNGINTATGGREYSFFEAGQSSQSTPNDDCAWGSQDTSPYLGTVGGKVSWCRWPHIISTTRPYGGYWWLRSEVNNGSTAYNAIGVTDIQSLEGEGFGVVQNGIINKDNASVSASIQTGENLTWADNNGDMNCSLPSGNCNWKGIEAISTVFGTGLPVTNPGVVISCTDCNATCTAGGGTGAYCGSQGGGNYISMSGGGGTADISPGTQYQMTYYDDPANPQSLAGATGVTVDSSTQSVVQATGGFSSGTTPPTACSGMNGCIALSEDSTFPSSTAGVDIIKGDATNHVIRQYINGAASAAIPNSATAPLALSASGVLSVAAATNTTAGVVTPDNSTIKIVGGLLTSTAGGGGTVTTTGSPASTRCAIFSGATSITGTADCTFASGALTLGASSVSNGVLNLNGTTLGTISATAGASADTLTFGGQFTSFIVPAGGVSAVNLGTAKNNGLYVVAAGGGFGYSAVGTSQFFTGNGSTKVGPTSPWNFSHSVNTGSMTYQGGIDQTAAVATWGSATFRGGNVTGGTAIATAGGTYVLGGDNLGTGTTETAGDLVLRPGRSQAATTTNQQGQLLINQVYTLAGTATVGLVACAGNGTVSDCSGTTIKPFLGITRLVNGSAVDVSAMPSVVKNATSFASATFTAGHYACLDQTNGIQYVVDSSSVCPAGAQVGIVVVTETSANAHQIALTPHIAGTGGSGGGGTVTTTGSPASGQVAQMSGATSITSTGDFLFSAGTLNLGKAATSTGVLQMNGTTSGNFTVTPSATAATVTLGGSGFGTLIVPNGSATTASIGSAAGTGLYHLDAGIGHTTAGVADFYGGTGTIKAAGDTTFSSYGSTNNNTFQGGFDTSSTTANLGSAVLRGADATAGASSGATGGVTVVRGGDNAQTGATESGGNVFIRAGRSTAATTTNNQGQLVVDTVMTKSGTATVGLVACISGNDVVSDCSGTTIVPFLGVSQAVNGLAVDVATSPSTITNGTSFASTAFTAGHYACLDLTNGIQYVADSATPCLPGAQVGIITATETSAAAHQIFLTSPIRSTATLCSGSFTFAPGAVASNACSTAVTQACTGLATTDVISLDFSGDPTSTTGYTPGAMGTIVKYPLSGNINVKYCNNTGASITPASVTLNYRVAR